MKCPVCIQNNQTSTVESRGGAATLMGFLSFRDEKGVYHSHDPNTLTEDFLCSNKHRFFVARKRVCDCGWGRKDFSARTVGVPNAGPVTDPAILTAMQTEG